MRRGRLASHELNQVAHKSHSQLNGCQHEGDGAPTWRPIGTKFAGVVGDSGTTHFNLWEIGRQATKQRGLKFDSPVSQFKVTQGQIRAMLPIGIRYRGAYIESVPGNCTDLGLGLGTG